MLSKTEITIFQTNIHPSKDSSLLKQVYIFDRTSIKLTFLSKTRARWKTAGACLCVWLFLRFSVQV